VRQQIEEIKEEIKREGITDPTEYIEKQLKGLKLDPTQKQLLKDCVGDEGAYKENI
jgi:hypothetical protein